MHLQFKLAILVMWKISLHFTVKIHQLHVKANISSSPTTSKTNREIARVLRQKTPLFSIGLSKQGWQIFIVDDVLELCNIDLPSLLLR